MERKREGQPPGKREIGNVTTREPDFPNLTAMADFDRQAHIERAVEAGLTREQAEKHADEHVQERRDHSA